MKTRIIFVVLFIMEFVTVFGHVNLKYPEGGEEFNSGEKVILQWEVLIDHGEADWDLFYSSDDGENWTPIVSNLAKDILEYEWTVPENPTLSGKIRVVQNNHNAVNYTSDSESFTINKVTGLESEEKPNAFVLYNAYPNPFNNSTIISFYVPQQEHVRVAIFNTLGEGIETLLNKEVSAGYHNLNWSAQNVTSGVYFYSIQTKSQVKFGKLVLLK